LTGPSIGAAVYADFGLLGNIAVTRPA
jgi:hypothetical protein